jgi:beta-glucanase (GH16 family)
MIRREGGVWFYLNLTFLLLAGACASVGPNTRDTAWTLAWSDEFDGLAGASFDRAKWVADTGGQGWGNQEREFYTTRGENVALDGNGHLVITAEAEPASSTYTCWYGRCGYTSARIKTQGRFSQAYGRFEARIRIPRGQGLWPAFWMLGDDIASVGWPRSGEVDVMENIGREPQVVHGTMHGPGYSGAGGIGGPDTLRSGAFADDFHLYAVEWGPGEVKWFVDGNEYFRTTPTSLPAGTTWVFDHPFFLILNLAVGGGWPGDPDATTAFPQRMVVDYVRVYRR